MGNVWCQSVNRAIVCTCASTYSLDNHTWHTLRAFHRCTLSAGGALSHQLAPCACNNEAHDVRTHTRHCMYARVGSELHILQNAHIKTTNRGWITNKRMPRLSRARSRTHALTHRCIVCAARAVLHAAWVTLACVQWFELVRAVVNFAVPCLSSNRVKAKENHGHDSNHRLWQTGRELHHVTHVQPAWTCAIASVQ